MKPRNHVARAQQSGAGKHKDKTERVFKTAMRQALEAALQERQPNNVRSKEGQHEQR